MGILSVLFTGTYLVVLLAMMLIAIALSVASYILMGLGLSAIAKRRGIPNPWLAWIPVGDSWLIGAISDQYRQVVHGQVRHFRKLLLWFRIGMMAAGMVAVPCVWIMSFGTSLIAVLGLRAELVAIIYVCAMLLYILIILLLSAANIVALILQYMALYDLFHSCNPDLSIIYLLVSIFVAYPLPVFVFICRNKDLGMPPVNEELPEKFDSEVLIC